jgi:hypothetical protein
MAKMMAEYMAKIRANVLPLLYQGCTDMYIHQVTGHSRTTIKKIRDQVAENPAEVFKLQNALGAPKKMTQAVVRRVEELTLAERHMTCDQVATIISRET